MTDSIEKQIVLRATPARVWRALSDAREFSAWFGVAMRDDFVAGQPAHGDMTYQGRDITMQIHVERMEPERLFAFRWHPYALEPGVDYDSEPTTLVELRLEPVAEGTRLTIVESGFDGIPAARRAKAFDMNTRGWSAQADNIARHVHG